MAAPRAKPGKMYELLHCEDLIKFAPYLTSLYGEPEANIALPSEKWAASYFYETTFC